MAHERASTKGTSGATARRREQPAHLVVDLGLQLDSSFDDVDRSQTTVGDATTHGTSNGETLPGVRKCLPGNRRERPDVLILFPESRSYCQSGAVQPGRSRRSHVTRPRSVFSRSSSNGQSLITLFRHYDAHTSVYSSVHLVHSIYSNTGLWKWVLTFLPQSPLRI